MPKLPITPRQAGFLNAVADAARNYKQSCEHITSNAARDIERLNNNQKPQGPNHQTMFEHVKYFGQLESLLANTFMVFDPTIFEESENAREDRKKFIDDVNSWLEIALADPTDGDYRVYFQSESSQY